MGWGTLPVSEHRFSIFAYITSWEEHRPMIQFWELDRIEPQALTRLMRRAETDIRSLLPAVQEVIDRVGAEGDAAVVHYAQQFDTPVFQREMLRAEPEDFAAARAAIDKEVVEALEQAHDNIYGFPEEQMPEPKWFMEVHPGIMAGEKIGRASCRERVERAGGARDVKM